MKDEDFKRLTPLAIKIGDVLAAHPLEDVAAAIGMNIGLNSETPEELEDTLELVRIAAAQFRYITLRDGEGH